MLRVSPAPVHRFGRSGSTACPIRMPLPGIVRGRRARSRTHLDAAGVSSLARARHAVDPARPAGSIQARRTVSSGICAARAPTRPDLHRSLVPFSFPSSSIAVMTHPRPMGRPAGSRGLGSLSGRGGRPGRRRRRDRWRCGDRGGGGHPRSRRRRLRHPLRRLTVFAVPAQDLRQPCRADQRPSRSGRSTLRMSGSACLTATRLAPAACLAGVWPFSHGGREGRDHRGG